MGKKENRPWLLQLISILICLSFIALTIIVFNMCKGGANLGLLLIFFAISAIIWGIYVISSLMAISGAQPIRGGINARLLASIADVKSRKEESNERWSYYSHIEGKAKFGFVIFLTAAVFSYALHWLLAIVLIICSFIVYFYIKKKSTCHEK